MTEAYRPEETVATGCEWKQDADGNWETGCGDLFCLNDSSPLENGMKFCCYCGLTLDEVPYDDDSGDEEANQMGLDALKEEDETWLAEHPEVKS